MSNFYWVLPELYPDYDHLVRRLPTSKARIFHSRLDQIELDNRSRDKRT
jgi:hypothetical protein